MKRIFLCSVAVLFLVVGVHRYPVTAASLPEKTVVSMNGVPVVSGTVSYRGRTELPGMAMVHVSLLDVSAKNPLAAKLGEQTIWIAGGNLPVTFRIAYDPSRIDPSHIYIVQARILEGEKLLFINTMHYYVLTRGAPGTADIIVTPVR